MNATGTRPYVPVYERHSQRELDDLRPFFSGGMSDPMRMRIVERLRTDPTFRETLASVGNWVESSVRPHANILDRFSSALTLFKDANASWPHPSQFATRTAAETELSRVLGRYHLARGAFESILYAGVLEDLAIENIVRIDSNYEAAAKHFRAPIRPAAAVRNLPVGAQVIDRLRAAAAARR